MENFSFVKYILIIIGCLVYLMFFSRSNKYSKKGETYDDGYSIDKQSELFDDMEAWTGKVVSALLICWCLYELFNLL